jgi:hypothetical protein
MIRASVPLAAPRSALARVPLSAVWLVVGEAPVLARSRVRALVR